MRVATTAQAMPSDLLRVADLSAAALGRLLDLAAEMKAEPRGWTGTFAGEAVACLFEKPSTRTRASLEVAAHRLGLLPVMLRPDELQLGRGEPMEDTARVLAGYCAAIAMRVFEQTTLETVAHAADVPVVNLLSGQHHPCQALADLLTLRERFGRLAGLRLAYVGDGNNVAHSLLEAGALAGMHVAVACPNELRPSPEVVARARRLAAAQGGGVEVGEDPRAAVAGAHAVYTDVWVSMGDELHARARRERLAGHRVDRALMALADADAAFLHCLPARRGEEVAGEVIDGPRSAVWRQAANRLPTEQAVLYALVAGARG